ncbi:nucleotide exchange factor GrpE [Oenococcus alcoholitolerans]|uniref:Protein GrpE n=1 Tax=Oenococcus alcoholitolerans TaxID=931074 RepID=A0ABR4XPU0_9LACO|nr:molecular chaperone GrpE [Oenococcus alcoholitolerans]
MEKEKAASEEQIEQAVKDSKKKQKTNASNNQTADSSKKDNAQQKQPDKDNKQSEEKKIDFEDKFYRAEAEIQNMGRRFEKERANILKYEGQSLAKSILPALDNLQRALAIEADDENSKKIKKGVELTYKSLKNALVDNGISEIGEVGQTFDPMLHNAIQKTPISDPNKQKENTIAIVLQKGYKLHDRVLRPAMVSVYQD